MNLDDIRARMSSAVTSVGSQWYSLTNSASEPTAELRIYDEITPWGITAEDLVRDLRAVTASVLNVRLNSPGGLVFDGITIYNALRDHPATVHVTVDGYAASIGSVIAMAGKTVTMNRGSHMMIHDASGGVIGNAAEMREMAEILDKVSGTIAGIYADRAGGTADQWRGHMRAETWYTAQEAVDAGLADTVAGESSTEDSTATNRSRLIMARHRALVAREGVKS